MTTPTWRRIPESQMTADVVRAHKRELRPLRRLVQYHMGKGADIRLVWREEKEGNCGACFIPEARLVVGGRVACRGTYTECVRAILRMLERMLPDEKAT